MADWELLDFNPATGLKKYIRAGDEPDSVQVKYESNHAPILDANKAAQNESWDKRADTWHAAHIPIGVMYEWLVRYGVNAWKYASDPDVRKKVNALLNDPEWRYLRVRNFII